jgi:CobQ-like glutamine amidotransferase family enzyme
VRLCKENDMSMELKICHLYPEVLNLYGDRGNILCIKRRLEARGISCSVTGAGIGDEDTLAGYDLFFIGGGQDLSRRSFCRILEAARPTRSDPPFWTGRPSCASAAAIR